MSTVEVKASRHYRVEIGGGLLETLGEEAARLCRGRKVCIVTDDQVGSRYGQLAKEMMEASGFTAFVYTFPHGEKSKCGAQFLALLEQLAQWELTRQDLLVALGGGVTGDLTGFAAACYLRGIDCIQVPTSLLAMVDSSVGGKTAIDLSAGKNLCGAFWQPKLVLCDTALLRTLPHRELMGGCAEVIKYGVLGCPELLERLRGDLQWQDWNRIITLSVTMKRDIVEADERDTGKRQLLNLGHTLGHAVEQNSAFALSHGEAVSIGMAMILRAAADKELCSAEDRDTVLDALTACHLPTKTDQKAEDICKTALGDKKRMGDTLTLVVPHGIGDCRLEKIPISQLSQWCL